MKRPWYVRPRENGVIAPEDLAQALVDASTVLLHMGGYLSVAQLREPTEFEGEMVSTLVMIEWKDRTDAKPQPERAAALPARQPDPTPAELEQQLEAEATSEEAFLERAERDEDLSSMGASAA